VPVQSLALQSVPESHAGRRTRRDDGRYALEAEDEEQAKEKRRQRSQAIEAAKKRAKLAALGCSLQSAVDRDPSLKPRVPREVSAGQARRPAAPRSLRPPTAARGRSRPQGGAG
jgi:hypothetical protein